MTDSTTLSRTAPTNTLYLAAFGDASQSEERGKCSSRAALTLKVKRRKLFNNLVESDEGYERLLTRAATCPDEYRKTLDFTSMVFGKIEEKSDDEDGAVTGDSGKTVLDDTSPIMRPKTVKNLHVWNDEDMYDNNESYFSRWIKNDELKREKPAQEETSPLESGMLKRRRLDDDTDDEYEGEADDEDNSEEDCDQDDDAEDLTDEEDDFDEEITRIITMKNALSEHKESFEENNDCLEDYQDDKWSTKAELTESDFYEIAVDDDTDDESPMEFWDDSDDDDERLSTFCGSPKQEFKYIDPVLLTIHGKSRRR